MSRYCKGADFERAVKRFFEDKGCFVVRSAGSRGVVDLVVFEEGLYQPALFIQCKRGYVSSKSEEDLVKVAERYGAIPILAKSVNGCLDLIVLPSKTRWDTPKYIRRCVKSG